MGLVAAGVNGIKLDVGDEVIGLQVLPQAGDLFLVTSDGKAKRVAIKDFPTQGRYGKGVRAWELPRGVKLAGMGIGKGTTHLTLHLLKAAAKTDPHRRSSAAQTFCAARRLRSWRSSPEMRSPP